jgi:arylsulfatase A-like enzyme
MMSSIKTISLAVGLVLASAHVGRAGDQTPRPNLVFIYTDDQRWDAMSVVQREQGDKGRFPWLKTPNMDRLAAEGVRFRNAFVVNSLCAPSRASFLTGCYGHLNGIVNNHTPFPVDNVTHASLLKGAGYTTAYFGKWHMDGQKGQRPGFDYSASFVGQGRYLDCPIEINGKTTETKGWVDDVTTDYGVRFIRDNKDRPFLLVLGFKATHGPFQPPPRFKDTYAGEEARAVPNLRSPAVYKANAAKPVDPPADKVPTNLGYFRCITAADENLGRILQTLDDLKLAENTVVVFSSDNGYYLGEHGLGDKRSAYEESMRIPLLVRYPKAATRGKTLDQLALNIDLAPTLLDYAGVPVPREMQGRSWRPLLEGKKVDWRRAFFYCYFFERGFATPTVTAVRTETAKLIKYPGHDNWTELFDLSRDPYETKNLVADAASADLRRDLEAEYTRQEKAIGFRIPPFADSPTAEETRSAAPGWVLVYRFDKDEGDRIIDASGKNNHGTAKDVRLVEGRSGGKARAFDGKGYIEVPNSASLDPSGSAWTVEVTFKADKGDGVVLSRGGKSNGYCLYLEGGCPVFTVISQNKSSRIAARQAVSGAWTKVTARITAGKELVLLGEDKEVARGPLNDLIRQNPRNSMQIGADLGSAVVADRQLTPFVGQIESVRIYRGEAP